MSDDEGFNDQRLNLGVHPETDLQEGNTAVNASEQLPPRAWQHGCTDQGILIDPVTGQPVIMP